MNDKIWCVTFERTQTGEKAYREYPQIAQWSNRASLNKALQNRTFLTEFICSDIQLIGVQKQKHALAENFGKLIYA